MEDLYEVTIVQRMPDGKTKKSSVTIREETSLEIAYHVGSRLAEALYLKESGWCVKPGEEPVVGDKYAWMTMMPTDNDIIVYVVPSGTPVE